MIDELVNYLASLLEVFLGSYSLVVSKLIVAISVFATTLLTSRYIIKLLLKTIFKTAPIHVGRVVSKFIYYAIVIIGVLATISFIGVDLSSLLIASGFLGIVLGLAAQTSLGEAIAGMFFTAEGSLRVGDRIVIDDVICDVIDVGFLSTKVRTIDGQVIRVPNSKLITSKISNLSKVLARRYEFTIGISYASDVKKAVKVIKKVLSKSTYVLAEPEPEVLIEGLGDSSVNLRIWVWIPTEWWWEVRKHIIREVKEALDAAGIEIPYPQRVVWLRGASITDVVTDLRVPNASKGGEEVEQSA